MKFHKTLTSLMLAIGLIFTLSAWAQQKPFTQEQVSNMVRDGFGDESGAKLVKQRGIDFAPDEDFMQSLKAAGASEAFLKALRAAKPPEPAIAKTPIKQIQVFALLAAQVSSHRVAMLVHERGIDFDPKDDYFQEVRLAGGTDELVGALMFAEATKRVTADAGAQALQVKVRQYVARGAELEEKGQYVQAEQEYRAALLLDSQNADIYMSLGYVLAQQKKWDDAESAERAALRLNPNNDLACYSLAVVLGEKGDRDGAIMEYREALRLNPNNGPAHVNLGIALKKSGDLDGAIAEYREALRLNPKDGKPHVLIGIALGHKGDSDGEIAEYREALRINPNNEDAHVFLGEALEEKNDRDGAVAEFREALRLNPNDDAAHSNLVRTLKSTGKPRVSVELWWAGGVFKSEKQPNPAAEMTAFAQSCPQSTVTVDDPSADYTLRLSYGLDPRFNDGLSQIVNNQLHLIYGFTLFDHRGNMVGTQPVNSSLTEAAQGACKAALSTWGTR